MSYILGIDLGGTYIKYGILKPNGTIISHGHFPTGTNFNPQIIASLIHKTIAKKLKDKKISLNKVLSIGVGCPGTIDSKNNIVHISPNLKWKDVPFSSILSKELAVPIHLYNDATAAAYGEYWVGSGKNTSSFVLITIGTGIGGGIIIDGKIYNGSSGFAGEIGHMTILPNGPKCSCGNRGCLEALASATAIYKIARKKLKIHHNSSLHKHLKTNTLSTKIIFNAAKKKDAIADQIIKEAANYLGLATASLINILNPDIIAFGGGVASAGNILLTPLKAEAKKRALSAPFKNTKILKASLGNKAGFIGAAGLAYACSKKQL